MAAIDYLTLRTTLIYSAPGVQAPAGSIFTVGSSGVQTLGTFVTTIGASTISVSTLTGSTMIVSSITTSVLTLSTLTVSSINSNASGIGSFSTLRLSSLVSVSTISSASTIYTSSLLTTGNVGIGTAVPAGRLTSYTTSADHTAAPDGVPTNHQLLIANSKSGTTPYTMALGMDQTYGCGYINAAGNGAFQPVCLQTRGGMVGIGITNPGYTLHVNGAIFAVGDITAFSDQRYKQNIIRLDHSLDTIRSLSGYSYTRQDYRPGERQIGLLAQEVKAVLPEAVSYDSANDTYSVNYNCLMAPVVESIKELYDRIQAQQAEIRDQQSTIQKLVDHIYRPNNSTLIDRFNPVVD